MVEEVALNTRKLDDFFLLEHCLPQATLHESSVNFFGKKTFRKQNLFKKLVLPTPSGEGIPAQTREKEFQDSFNLKT